MINQSTEVISELLVDDGTFPNNGKLPLLICKKQSASQTNILPKFHCLSLIQYLGLMGLYEELGREIIKHYIQHNLIHSQNRRVGSQPFKDTFRFNITST